MGVKVAPYATKATVLLKIAASRDSRKNCENKMCGQKDENSDLTPMRPNWS